MQFSIRNATINDIEQIAEIHVACWKTAYKGIIDQNHLNNMSVEKSVGRNLLNLKRLQEKEFFLVAVTPDNLVLGFCMGGPQRDAEFSETGEVFALYISMEFQHLGIGTALLNKAFELLKLHSLTDVLVWALMHNKQKSFYSKNGGISKYIISRKIGNEYNLLEAWKWIL